MIKKKNDKNPSKNSEVIDSENIIDGVQDKIYKSVGFVKSKFEEWEEMFAEELDEVKKTAKQWSEKVKKLSEQVLSRVSQNWQTVIWVLVLAIWLRQLRQFVIWLVLVIAWVLFIVWYFSDKK